MQFALTQPTAEEKPMPVQRCHSHCSACGRCFVGVGAFDRHRQSGQCEDPTTILNKRGELAMAAWTVNGVCDKRAACWKDGKRVAEIKGVTIWQITMSDEAKDRLQALRGPSLKDSGAG